jgi:cytoskeletal protein CcmA (bactofilin family)
MFKKSDTDYPQPETTTSPTPPRSNAAEPRKEGATIGPSISIKGDLTGDEDLMIQGRVEGKIDLKQNNITIGKNGRVKADVYGKVISIEGEVEGNLFGQDQIVVRSSGNVRGNITAPRVALEDGSRFKGSIDMEPRVADKQKQAAPAEVKAMPKSEAGSEAKTTTPYRPEPSLTRA